MFMLQLESPSKRMQMYETLDKLRDILDYAEYNQIERLLEMAADSEDMEELKEENEDLKNRLEMVQVAESEIILTKYALAKHKFTTATISYFDRYPYDNEHKYNEETVNRKDYTKTLKRIVAMEDYRVIEVTFHNE